jgi:hypothetical protein
LQGYGGKILPITNWPVKISGIFLGLLFVALLVAVANGFDFSPESPQQFVARTVK